MGGQRLHGDLRGLSAARRPRRRPARPPAGVRRGPGPVRAGLAGRRGVRQPGRADRRPRGPGPGRRGDRPRLPVDPHHHVRRGPGAQPRGRHLGRDGRSRRSRRRAAGRRDHRSSLLALDPLHQRPHRPAGRVRRAALHHREQAPDEQPRLRPERRAGGHDRAVAARAGHRAHRPDRLGIGADARHHRRRDRAAGRLRGDRGQVRPRAADAAADLGLAHAERRQRRRAAGRRRHLRDVVLRLAVPAAGARLLADPRRPGLPADDAVHRGRLDDRLAHGRPARAPSRCWCSA